MVKPQFIIQFRRRLIASIVALGLVGLSAATTPTEVKAAFPGYNGKIIYRVSIDGNNELFTMDQSGQNATNLTEYELSDSSARWSSDGSKIVFQRTLPGVVGHEIYSMNADGSNVVRLTNNNVDDTNPDWSPDGNRVVFSSLRSASRDIYIMNADGSEQSALTEDSIHDMFPVWSPDGDLIAFNRTIAPSNDQIMIIEPDGSNMVNLSQNAYGESYPDWSPDGSQITFSTNQDGVEEIFVMDADGSNRANLSNHPAIDYSSTFSSDGNYIVFTSFRDDGKREIYRMNLDGTNQLRLTNTEYDNDHARWQPIPNTSPALGTKTLQVISGTPQAVDVLADATDEESLNPANLTIHTQPSHGTASIESGKVKYVPNSGYVGADELTYQICDSFMLDQKCSTAVLGITVKPAATIAKVGETVVENGVEKVVAQTNRPTFTGTATPGSTVKVEIHSDPIVLTTTADAQGNWSVTPEQDLPVGDHTVKITATLNGVTTELDSFVLAVQQTIPNTGFNSLPVRVGGGMLLIAGIGLMYWQRKKMHKIFANHVPNLFP